jgi:transcriptional regulator with GAF, ATPase, and Fis domain
MNPRIIAVFGPLKGETWQLTDSEFTIGRDAGNRLALDDLSLSRQHCVIRKTDDLFWIHDLNSRNGTFVNDAQVVESVLKHGDYLKVGNSLFRFLLDSGVADSEGNEIEFDDADWLTVSTEAFDLQALSLARDLRTLMQVSTTVNSVRGVSNIQRELLRLILEAIPAERAAIVTLDEGKPDLSSGYGLGRDSERLETIKISRTVVERVLNQRVGLVGNDLPGAKDDMPPDSASLAALQVRAFLCVPLILHEKAQGAVYLDSSRKGARFDMSHQSLLTAIAGIAAVALENARHVSSLETDNEQLRAELKVSSNMIGTSQPMQEIHRFIGKVAPSDSTVLIRGESGTGKELVARAIHSNSMRTEKPFVAINCATLSETLLESELFGYEKGAFTGANAQKKGKLEVASGGSIFLDEVGELAPSLQAKLLRVLQERKMERVGGIHPIELNIRIIAATNRDLEAALEQGVFRRDLFYRLNVVSCLMPSLKERKGDIPQLADSFCLMYANRCKRKLQGVSPEAVNYLMQYDWPGNVRELENVIERAVVLGSTEWIIPDDLPDVILNSSVPAKVGSAGLYELLREEKKRLISEVLEKSSDYTDAAVSLGIHPNNLHRLIKSLGIRTTRKA